MEKTFSPVDFRRKPEPVPRTRVLSYTLRPGRLGLAGGGRRIKGKKCTPSVEPGDRVMENWSREGAQASLEPWRRGGFSSESGGCGRLGLPLFTLIAAGLRSREEGNSQLATLAR